MNIVRKYHNHILQTNPWYREEERHNNHETHEDKLAKAISSSLPIKMIAKQEWTQSNVQQYTEQLQKTNNGSKVSKVAKIRNRYNQVPHLTQDTNWKVTNSQKTPQTRAKRSALSQQVTTKHI